MPTPDATFFIDAMYGAAVIKDYDANDDLASLREASRTGGNGNDESIRFHSSFEFLEIRGEVVKTTVSFPSFTRNVHSWSSGGKCYITTACCEHKGLDDDCDLLETLRNYRDNYMLTTLEGAKLVTEYYDVAPRIVELINDHERKDELYDLIYIFLLDAKEQIDKGLNEEALSTYRSMVEYVKRIGE